MLNYVIKYLEKFLLFLKERSEKTSIIKVGDKTINTSKPFKIIMIVLGALLSLGLSVSILDELGILIGTIVFIINIIILFTLYKNLNGKFLFLVYLPLIIGSFGIMLGLTEFYNKGFNYFNILLLIYPIIYILQYYFKFLDIKYINKAKNFFFLYNLGFFFFITLNILIISFGFNIPFLNIWSEVLIEISNVRSMPNFFAGILYLFGLSFVVLYWIYSLHVYYDHLGSKRVNLHKGILIIIVIYILSFTGNTIDSFYDYQLKKASNIITKEGENYESYKNAQVFLLDRAFLNRIKDGKNINRDLFKKIYDTTPESYFGEKIAEYTDSRFSFETNSSKIGDFAEVILKLAEIENRVFETSGEENTSLLETTYKFHFTNDSTVNQEVILNFETPSKFSVVSSLRLGLDLELIGQISSRGAAAKVYNDSLRKNIDPALIQKVGLNTYSLRVFPVLSKTDKKTQGRQLVEVKILTPLIEEQLIYSPSFSVINLKYDDSSSLLSKIYNKDSLIKEDIIKGGEIDLYISKNHSISISELGLTLDKPFGEICLTSDIQNELDENGIILNLEKEIGKKIEIFFDNSQSVLNNKADNLYEDIYDGFKGYDNKLNDVSLYSYNFDVNKITEVGDINYWGYSNIDRVINYIEHNNIKNKRIVFVTDDDSFNLNTKEYSGRNIKQLSSNNITVIKIGKKVKKYKSDFNTILAASNGNIYEVNSKEDIKSVLDKVMNEEESIQFKNCFPEVEIFEDIIYTGSLDNFTGSLDSFSGVLDFNINNLPINIDKNIQKIQAGIVSNLLLGSIQDINEWYEVAAIQTNLAEEYGIVNQFNSLIAIQTERQQRDLDRYNKNSDKYDVEYENFGGDNSSLSRDGGINFGSSSFSTNSIDSFKSESVQKSLMGVSDGLNGSSYSRNSDFYSGKINVSLLGLLIILVYLLEYIGIYSFIMKYIKQKKD